MLAGKRVDMDDREIIALYWERSDEAILETSRKYSRYCHSISFNILGNHEDAEECVNDTYLRAWNSIPPNRPNHLSAYLGRITRNLSFDKYRRRTAEKRGLGQAALALSELEDCLPGSANVARMVEEASEEKILIEAINSFLEGLPLESRMVFMRRYWHVSSIQEIARSFHMSESKVKSILFRTRKKLKAHLEEEGIAL